IVNLSSHVDTIGVTITNKQSLIDMYARTKVLVNHVESYRLYDEPVCSTSLS
ncbi:unnamed protein product, partial [Rotaria sp. Silwood2]